MPYAPIVNRKEIAEAVERAARALAPTVVRIRYSFEDDWTGDPSIFFRIVLSDEAFKEDRIGKVTWDIQQLVEREVKPEEQGLHAYFNYRLVSEQAELNEPAWA